VDESHIVFAGQVPTLVSLIQLTDPARVGSVATVAANHHASQGSYLNAASNRRRTDSRSLFSGFHHPVRVELLDQQTGRWLIQSG